MEHVLFAKQYIRLSSFVYLFIYHNMFIKSYTVLDTRDNIATDKFSQSLPSNLVLFLKF